MLKTIEWDFKPIKKPGLYSRVPMELYHSAKICDGPSVSSSGLRRCFSESPAHFYNQWPGNPDCIEEDDKAHFILGRAVHHLMLGEPFFAKLFAVQPSQYPEAMKGADPVAIEGYLPRFIAGHKSAKLIPWSNTAYFCKAWHAVQAKAGRAILTQAMVDQIKGIAAALSLHPIVRAGALNGMIERSIFWKDKATGLWLKSRPDSIPESSVDFVDLKKTRSVQWRDLQNAIFEYGYFQQGALMRTAAREVLGITNPTFTLVFVEDKPPHCVRVVSLKDNDLDRGERANRASLDTIARCMKAKQWPGPGGERDDAVGIELPEWAQKKIDDKIEFDISE